MTTFDTAFRFLLSNGNNAGLTSSSKEPSSRDENTLGLKIVTSNHAVTRIQRFREMHVERISYELNI